MKSELPLVHTKNTKKSSDIKNILFAIGSSAIKMVVYMKIRTWAKIFFKLGLHFTARANEQE